MAPAVLIVTNPSDFHADRVVIEMGARGKRVVRLHPEELSQGLSFSDEPHVGRGRFSHPGHEAAFEDVVSCWYRKPRPVRLRDPLPEAVAGFAQKELAHGFYGLLRCTECLWVSHPGRMIEAGWKPLQLRRAVDLGFEIPRTMVTNSSEDLLRFWESCEGEVIYKTLESPLIGGQAACYTSLVTRENLKAAGAISTTGGIFQALVAKSCDLRAIAIGERIFAFEIHIDGDGNRVDWRATDVANLKHQVHTLDPAAEHLIRRYLQAFDLRYGAFDFVLTPDGRYVFLECNPGGEFAWLEIATGVPLTHAMTDLLTLEAR